MTDRTHYQREFTHHRSTFRGTVYTDRDGVRAVIALEPSEGRLYQLSMPVDVTILDGLVNIIADMMEALDAAQAVEQEEEQAA